MSHALPHPSAITHAFPLVSFHQKFILQGLAQTFQVFLNSPFFHPKYRSQFIICSILPGNSHILIITQVMLGVGIYDPVYPTLSLSSSTIANLQYCT